MNTRRPPRKRLTISVLVDSDSWILPYAARLVQGWRRAGHRIRLCRTAYQIRRGELAFFLGCVRIVPPNVLRRSRHNLVVHESALPRGRGFAPVVWQVLQGTRRIPIVLFEAVKQADAGPIYLRDELVLEGHELMNEIRHLQGRMTATLCRHFVQQYPKVMGTPQTGRASWFRRRWPKDSRLHIEKTLHEQFSLLRTVDNERYPAYFDHAGHRYFVRIEKARRNGSSE